MHFPVGRGRRREGRQNCKRQQRWWVRLVSHRPAAVDTKRITTKHLIKPRTLPWLADQNPTRTPRIAPRSSLPPASRCSSRSLRSPPLASCSRRPAPSSTGALPRALLARHGGAAAGGRAAAPVLDPRRLRFLRVQVGAAAGGAAENHRLRVRGGGGLQPHPRAGAVLQPKHRRRALLLGGQQLLPEEEGHGRHLRLHRHRPPHHHRPEFFRLLLPLKCKCCWNINDSDRGWDWDRRHDRGNPGHLHAGCRHEHRHGRNRRGDGRHHRGYGHWVRRPRSNRHEQHGHGSSGLAASKVRSTCLPRRAPLRPGIRMKLDHSLTLARGRRKKPLW